MENQKSMKAMLRDGVMRIWITKGPCLQRSPSSPGKQLCAQIRNTSQGTVSVGGGDTPLTAVE